MRAETNPELTRMLAMLADAERGDWPEVESEEPLPPGMKERIWLSIRARLGLIVMLAPLGLSLVLYVLVVRYV